MNIRSLDMETCHGITGSHGCRAEPRVPSGILFLVLACSCCWRMSSDGLVYQGSGISLIHPEGFEIAAGALGYFSAAYRALVIGRQDVLLKLLVEDPIQRVAASDAARIRGQIPDAIARPASKVRPGAQQ